MDMKQFLIVDTHKNITSHIISGTSYIISGTSLTNALRNEINKNPEYFMTYLRDKYIDEEDLKNNKLSEEKTNIFIKGLLKEFKENDFFILVLDITNQENVIQINDFEMEKN